MAVYGREKLAEFIHCGQKRKNGEPYIEHPRRVAKAIKELGYDGDVGIMVTSSSLEKCFVS